MKLLLCALLAFLITICSAAGARAQSKISDGSVSGTSAFPDSNAILELESRRKGFLLPRVALDSSALPAPLGAHTAGMSVYNTATVADLTPGYYYNDGSKWLKVSTESVQVLSGDASLADDIPVPVMISSATGSTVTATVASRTFTLTGSSLVTILYSVRVGSIRDAGATVITDGVPRLLTNFIRFAAVPPGSSVSAGSTAAFASFPYTSTAGGGATGYFNNNATLTVVLAPGTYTVSLIGSVFGSTKSVEAEFGGAGANRFSIVANRL